jgi:uncharacterized membrane-anchored protein YjiN (DUF445 family)
MAGLLSTMEELRDPDHPWRVELSQAVEKLIAELATDPDMHAVGERMKAQLLANPLLLEQARSLWDEIERGLESDPQARAETAARTVEVGLHNFGRWLEQERIASGGSTAGSGCSCCACSCRVARRSAPT